MYGWVVNGILNFAREASAGEMLCDFTAQLLLFYLHTLQSFSHSFSKTYKYTHLFIKLAENIQNVCLFL